MPWKIVRLWIELTSTIGVLRVFQDCHSLTDGWQRLQETDEVQRMGLIVATVILITGANDILRMLTRVLRRPC